MYNDIDVGVGEMNINFYTPPHNSGGVLWFHVGRPCVCPSVHRTYVRPSIGLTSVRPFLFPYGNLSKHQWTFIKLDTCMCIDIVEIWFGIANGQISSEFYRVICPRHVHIFVYNKTFKPNLLYFIVKKKKKKYT